MLEIKEYWELLALHKAIMEVKFSEKGKKEFLSSPFLAEVARKNMVALIEAERNRSGEEKAGDWEKWRQIDEARSEWNRLVLGLDEITHLKGLDENEIASIIRDILSPLTITDEKVSEIIKNNIK